MQTTDDGTVTRRRNNSKRLVKRSQRRRLADFKKSLEIHPCDVYGKRSHSTGLARNALCSALAATFYPKCISKFKSMRKARLCDSDRLRFHRYGRALKRPFVTHDQFASALQSFRNIFGVLKSPRKRQTGSTYGALLCPGMRMLFNLIPISFDHMASKKMRFLDIGHGDGSVVLYASLVRGLTAWGIDNNHKFHAESVVLRNQIMLQTMKDFTAAERKAVSFPHLLHLDFTTSVPVVGEIVRKSDIIFSNNRVFETLNVSFAQILAEYASPGAYITVTDRLHDSNGCFFYDCLKDTLEVIEEDVGFNEEDDECLSWCANTTEKTKLRRL
eukprot:TRINITY_DN12163_c0_g1_i1.p1 TRINITY_DN12163_c0_g1~~TRINITY_DN12163_c0_g1_i1.p1  ORF type:complete len:329 (+),score=40.25 TRINITY_DN12163_c0_g1_i1:259-1245(+)